MEFLVLGMMPQPGHHEWALCHNPVIGVIADRIQHRLHHLGTEAGPAQYRVDLSVSDVDVSINELIVGEADLHTVVREDVAVLPGEVLHNT